MNDKQNRLLERFEYRIGMTPHNAQYSPEPPSLRDVADFYYEAHNLLTDERSEAESEELLNRLKAIRISATKSRDLADQVLTQVQEIHKIVFGGPLL